LIERLINRNNKNDNQHLQPLIHNYQRVAAATARLFNKHCNNDVDWAVEQQHHMLQLVMAVANRQQEKISAATATACSNQQ